MSVKCKWLPKTIPIENWNAYSKYEDELYDLFKKESSLFSEADKLNRLLYSSAKWYILRSNPTDRISAYETFINSMVWKMQNMNEFKFVAWEMEKNTR